MAYSDNPETLNKMRPQLEPLLRSSEVTWRVEGGATTARRFAYKIREALRLARQTGDPLGSQRFRVEIISSQRVRATLIQPFGVEIEDTSAPPPAALVDSRQLLSDGWLEEIISTWQRRSPLEGRVHFPRAWPDRQQLLDLWSWAQEAEVLIFEHEGAVTLLPRAGNEDTAPFAWDPEDIDE